MVFHLAAAVSGECEADFDLGMRSNFDATRALLDACRALGSKPTFVFASSLAVFGNLPGQPLPEPIRDFTLPTPQSSYGIQKFIGEQLVADYARKGFIRGRSVRLMTVSVRPGRPNGAASSFLSGMIREPLAGQKAACPVAPETSVALSSPARTIEGIIRAAQATDAEWGPLTAVNLPSLRTTVGEMAAALERVAGKAATDAAGLDARSGDRAAGQDLARQRHVRTRARARPAGRHRFRVGGARLHPRESGRGQAAGAVAHEETNMGPGLLLGCIADDFTGATDLANNLVRSGMRTVQTIGVPAGPLEVETDAVVVALKTRTTPPAEAVQQSLEALRWLQAQGARQIYFKYCSTFDSTAHGNIGPVTEALMDALGTDFTIATPAFPDNQRTVFKGYLFVGDVLLSESGMRDHPLTPMTDANLVRVLQAQCRRKVGLIDYRTVAAGEAAIRQRIAALRAEGVAIAVVDALSNDDLLRLGPALKDLPLVTAGSGVAIGLPANFGLRASEAASRLPPGSARARWSRAAVRRRPTARCRLSSRPAVPRCAIDPLRIAAGDDVVAQTLAWAKPLLAKGPVLVYSTADPDAVKAVQGRLGVEQAGAMVERAIAAIARGLVDLGVRQLVVAGGETSGACVQALGVRQLQIGPQIDPGVPWCWGRDGAGRPSAHGAEVGQFRRRRFLQQGLRAAAMNEQQAREEICRVGKSLFDRGWCTRRPATSACGWTTVS